MTRANATVGCICVIAGFAAHEPQFFGFAAVNFAGALIAIVGAERWG